MQFNIPDLSSTGAICLGRLTVEWQLPALDDQAIHRSLLSPIWMARNAPWTDQAGTGATPEKTVFDTVKPGESLCIVVSDHTRRTAADRVLPVLVNGLVEAGCSAKDMFVLFATGIHRHPTPREVTEILGAQIARQFEGRIYFHDPDDQSNLVTVGRTRRFHNVEVNRRAMEADRLALVGGVTYHYHAGFSGGRKSLVPGLAGRKTIACNHSLTLDPHRNRIHPNVEAGIMDGNPVAEEMLESARMCDPDFIINTVLLPDGRLAGVFAGELDSAHRAACALAGQIYRRNISKRADFVIASAGSASNWIQSHKALYNADRAVRRNGRIILTAPCPEGLGDERFRYWIKKPNVDEIFNELRKSPEVLGQTALSSRVRGARTVLVTGMPPADAADLGIRTAADLISAVNIVLDDFRAAGNRKPTYYILPEAMYTVPQMERLKQKTDFRLRPYLPIATADKEDC